jgi:tetracenomycin A2 monooxygenase-dioxygenase
VRCDGEVISTIDLYDGGFILLTGPDGSGWVNAADKVRAELTVPLRVFGFDTVLSPVDETIADLLKRYGLEPSGAVLIRPDGFVGFRAARQPAEEYETLRSAFDRILDLTHA